MIDLSNMNIPAEIFEESKSFTLPDVFKLIDAEYGEDDDPTTDKPSNDETDTDTNSTTSTNEEGTGSTETNSKEISIKESVGNDISPLALDLLDLIEEPEVEIPDAPEEPAKYDTIAESNHSYERAEIIFASDQPEDQFEVLNPVDTYKRDDCVISRRNFVFEMDDTPLEEQKKYLKDLIAKKIVNRWVFSGNKSIDVSTGVITYDTVDLSKKININLPEVFVETEKSNTKYKYSYNFDDNGNACSENCNSCEVTLSTVKGFRTAEQFAKAWSEYQNVSMSDITFNNIKWYTFNYEFLGNNIDFVTDKSLKLYYLNIKDLSNNNMCKKYIEQILSSISFK